MLDQGIVLSEVAFRMINHWSPEQSYDSIAEVQIIK